MSDKQTPPDWVLLEAAKRCGWTLDLTWLRADYHSASGLFRALCDMIEKYEQPPPVDEDEEALERILAAWRGWDADGYDRKAVNWPAALAQFKRELEARK